MTEVNSIDNEQIKTVRSDVFKVHGIIETKRRYRPLKLELGIIHKKKKFVELNDQNDREYHIQQMIDEIQNRIDENGTISPFGLPLGFAINFSPEHAVRFDLEGNELEELEWPIKLQEIAFKEYEQKKTETTLSDAFLAFKNSEIPVLLLTKFRDDPGANCYKNQSKNRSLRFKIREAGYGTICVDGFWAENKEENDPDASGFSQREIPEDLILVWGPITDNGKLKGIARKIMKEHFLDTVIFKPEDSLDVLLMKNDGTHEVVGPFTREKIAKAFAELRNLSERDFTFESARYFVNFYSRMAYFKTGYSVPD